MTKREKWSETVNHGKSEKEKTLIDRASSLLETNILVAGDYPWGKLRGVVPSVFTYKGVWNWDAAFHTIAVARWDAELAFDQCKIIWNTQLENGMFCDVTYANGKTDYGICKPPVFPWAFMKAYRINPEPQILETAYDRYVKNENFWCSERCSDGLFHYDSIDCGIYAKFESGWDTSVRWDNGVMNLWAVDLNCYMVMFYEALSEMADELKKTDDAVAWKDKKNVLAEMIKKYLWSDKYNAFCDTDMNTNEHSDVLSPACFMPLYAGFASIEQAEKLALLAADEQKFYPLMPTVAYDNPQYSSGDYWRGPTWLNTSYFALKGLKKYGYGRLADEMKEQVLNAVYLENDCIFEYYDSKTGKGLGARQFGWSAAFVIEFILDF